MNKDKVRFSIFGASHADSVGVSIEGIRFGEPIDGAELQGFLNRRKPVFGFSTARSEPDEIIFERGVENGVTTGGEIIARIYNVNARRSDYTAYNVCPRPSHADYVAKVRYGKEYDVFGGGIFSGRMTAPLCIAGGIALQILKRKGVSVGAYIQAVGGVSGKSYRFTDVDEQAVMSVHGGEFPLLDEGYKTAMLRAIEGAAARGDSCGGVVECCVFGLPVGTGDVLTDSLESAISANLFTIPAVKGVEFGSGFALSDMRGSSANDEFYYDESGAVRTTTNHNGGINGGLANGMPVTLRVAFKPTPSISGEQKTVNLQTGENTVISVKGRHDACFVPRAVPAVEAAVALALINYL